MREAAERADFRRRTRVLQRNLPRPSNVDIDALLQSASGVADPAEHMIARETALLIVNDARKYPAPGSNVKGSSRSLEAFNDEALDRARVEIALEMPSNGREEQEQDFLHVWSNQHEALLGLPGLGSYEKDEVDEQQALTEAFNVRYPLLELCSICVNAEDTQGIQKIIMADAEKGNKLEKKLALHNGGYQQRAKTLRQKIVEASEALEKEKIGLDTFRTLQITEEAALPRRLEALREEYMFVQKREREMQELYRSRAEELASMGKGLTNGVH